MSGKWTGHGFTLMILCVKWDRKPRNGKPIWNQLPCIEHHIHAVDLEQARVHDGRIISSFEKIWELEERSLKSALLCLYWLCK